VEINKYIGKEWPDIEVFPIWRNLWQRNSTCRFLWLCAVTVNQRSGRTAAKSDSTWSVWKAPAFTGIRIV
jgi:hypothetical protein